MKLAFPALHVDEILILEPNALPSILVEIAA
jgi:hypothetical protein